jgi:hypothetical protein
MESPMSEEKHPTQTGEVREAKMGKRVWTTPQMEAVDITKVTEVGRGSAMTHLFAFLS